MSNPFAKAAAKPRRGLLLCILGIPGIGKSTWCSYWPGAKFLIDPRDQGILDLIDAGVVPTKYDDVLRPDNYKQYLSGLHELLNDDSCKTIVCESVLGIQDLCWDESSRMDYENDLSRKKFLNFYDGPTTADTKYFRPLLDAMLVAQNRGKHVVLTGHSKVRTLPNVEGEDPLTATLSCEKNFAARIDKTFSAIFHIVNMIDPVKKGNNYKVSGEGTRFVHCTTNPQYFAKNRMGLLGGFAFPSNGKEAWFAMCDHCKRDRATGYIK